jgi:uncharacterized protein (DUF302 family)
MKKILFTVRTALILLFAISTFPQTTSAQMKGPKPPAFLVTTPSNYDFADTVDLLKGTIEENNLMVIQEVDAQRMLRMVNVKTGGMKQILFFHPRYMKKIISANRNAGIVPPLKVIVMERPDGKVMVRYDKPAHQFEGYEGLSDIAEELEGLIQKVVASVKS